MSDRNGPFLSDRSLHRQVREKLQKTDDGRPLFNYVVTIDGHWMYDAGDKRPPVLASTSKIKEVGDYANLLHYKSRQMMDAIEAIRRDDPDALIVVFGDHLPMLGRKFAGYVESGLLPDNFGAFTRDNYDVAASTPLLVIDGRNGPLDLGNIPMYRLPRAILRLLGEETQAIFDLVPVPDAVIPRPLPDVMMTYQGGTPQQLCKDKTDSAACAAAAAWLSDALLLGHDLFAGNQHALKHLHRAPPARDDLHAEFLD
jgi:hypothetical protein